MKLNRYQRIILCVFGSAMIYLTLCIANWTAHHSGLSWAWPVLSATVAGASFVLAASD